MEVHSWNSSSGNSATSASNTDSLLEPTEPEVQQIAAELELMKGYLDNLELQLKTGVPACPPRLPVDCANIEPDLKDSSDANIRQLQRNVYKLEHQIAELFACSDMAKDMLTVLGCSFCQLQRDMRDARQQYDAVESIKLQTDHQASLCLQRYTHLCHMFANWSDSKENAKEMQSVFLNYVESMHTKAAYLAEKHIRYKQLEEAENICMLATKQLIRQAKDVEDYLDALLDVQLFSQVSCVNPGYHTVGELEPNNVCFKSNILPTIPPFVSFSSTWHYRMMHMIKHKLMLNILPKHKTH
ncbi:uncharacterized protein [Drosophila virilis]|uniref:Uncharacterized protein n=1 Tax=Drosophila virilis TaxID=7244 RepID=B4M755_DROVI|nr:uncharacterized protein LOC6633277 [Drosophila virilis]EDW62622.1 uncharacterized protein Dvir_GJ16921 [Drosophila virilis]